ncbi:MAG: PBP1A family penicillin-binding protein [Nitrospiraceae bacterium]|nr:PBP1A family penicillin-binding protein [Nitrospiraceae bacterium]
MSLRSIIGYGLLFLAALLTGGAIGFFTYTLWDLPEVHTLEEYRPNITTRVYSDSNHLLAEFFVENRTPVKIDDVPDLFLRALIAAEDNRFYSHHGIDFRGLLRAMVRNIRAGRILEGGSTLTQQLAKVLFLTPERSYTRKLKEILLALKIEQRYTKQEILTLYLNQVYFGSGAYGIEAAAQTFFGKPARDLTLGECALLAGLPRSPKYYSPFRSRDLAKERRAYVLRRMIAGGIISQQQADEAGRTPLPDHPTLRLEGPAPAPYFVEYIRQRVEERFGSGILYSGGLNIYTSISDELQGYAEQAVQKGLDGLDRRLRTGERGRQPLQAAVVVIDPATGHIRAMVGGRDFSSSQFNRAWQALRQPGSAFKPIIYAAALDRGYGAADLLSDTPMIVKIDAKKTWSPENFTRTYQGNVTLRKALAQSLNVPTVRLLAAIGIPEAITCAKRLGVRSPLKAVLPLALGSSDVTLLELTSAYAVFANQGIRMEPTAITSITDSGGRVLYTNDVLPQAALRPETAYLITNLLKGVVEQGTGWKAREVGRPVAGKTGTTNDYRDAWFIGYSPSLVAGVWVGYDDQRSLGPKATGSRAALPIWVDFMKRALESEEPVDFVPPPNILFRNIDPRTGLLSTEHCPVTLREAFVPGTEPHSYCTDTNVSGEDFMIRDEAPE